MATGIPKDLQVSAKHQTVGYRHKSYYFNHSEKMIAWIEAGMPKAKAPYEPRLITRLSKEFDTRILNKRELVELREIYDKRAIGGNKNHEFWRKNLVSFKTHEDDEGR